MAFLVWLNSECNCWTVSCISLQSAGSLLLCQEYRRTARWLFTLSVIWQIIIDFLKLLSDFDKNILNASLSLFLTAYHYSLGISFPAEGTKARAIEGCRTWMSLTLSDTEYMSSLDIYISLKPEVIKILKLCVFLIVIFLLGVLHLDFNQVLRHEETVCPVYLPLFHSHYASHGHLLEEWEERLNCGISRVLESWPFRCALSMHLCMVALWLFNKDEVCWHILLTSITYLPLQRRCMECSSFINIP